MENISVCNLITLTVDDFKERFPRGFKYYVDGEETTPETVYDTDILEAYREAKMTFDCSLFTKDEMKNMFLLLSAFYLLQDFKMNNGLSNTSSFVATEQQVGDVSAKYSIPDKIKNSPTFSYLFENDFGKKYAIMAYQRLVNKKRYYTGKPNLA